MADNVTLPGTGVVVSAEEVTTLNGVPVTAQEMQRMAAGVVTADGVAKDLLLGRNSDANSLSTALSTEDAALIGALTETAPATDTASSGGNGRLQRIAQRITSLIALFPAALGQTTKANSLAVAPASDWTLPKSDIAESTANGTSATTIIGPTDAGGYRSFSVQLTGTYTAQVILEESNDQSNWVTAHAWTANSNTLVTGANGSTGLYFGQLHARYFRVRISSYTSGTVVATLELFPVAFSQFSASTGSDVAIFGISPVSSVNSDGDGTNSSISDGAGNVLRNISRQFVSNGTNFDRVRNNISVSALASAARTATANADVTTYNAKTFRVILNITAAPNTASTLTLAIRVKDSISGNYVAILTGAAETGSVDTGAVPVTKVYSVGAGLVATANVSAAEALARTMNVIVTHSNADSWTYSVSVELGV